MKLPEILKSRGCRPYQIDAIEKIYNFFVSGELHVILQAATGAGKTWIFSQIAKLSSLKNKKVLILTDRAELLQQAGGTLVKNNLSVNYIIAGSKKVNQDYNVFVAMSQTLKRRITLEYWIKFLQSIDLLIIDECHKQEFNYIFLSQIFDKKHVIGFTATPARSGKMRQLGLDYEKIIETVPIKDLIANGYLVNDDYYGFESPDLSNVEYDRLKGDYKESSMFKKFNSPKTYSGAIKGYKKNTPGTKALTFCVNIEHVIRTCIEFNEAGIKSKFLVSKVNKPKLPKGVPDDEFIEEYNQRFDFDMTAKDWGEVNMAEISRYNERLKVYNLYKENIHLTGKREDILQEFRNNKFTNLVNAGILTTGYDEPGLITIIVLRATLSKTLWYQMLGRGSRPFASKSHFNILDFGDNQKRLGTYTSDQIWSLWHEESQGGGLPPIKNCGVDGKGKPITDKNGCTRPILAAYKICPFCGFVYPEKEKEEIDIDLIIFNQERKRALKVKGIKEMDFDELHEYWKLKKHKPPWLWYQLFSRGGIEEIENFGKENNWKSSTIRKAVEYVGG